MIGSSTPGISADVLGADIRARTAAAEERHAVEAMTRELRTARGGARRAWRTALFAALRRRPGRRVGQLTHGSAA
jgi:hypothetical protein